MTILDELKLYWKNNSLPLDGGLNDKFNAAKIGSFSFKYPNLDGNALVLHDINHLITGYKTNWMGECEVSAWELASGGRGKYLLSWIYPIVGFLIGLLFCPSKTFKAFVNGLRKRNSFIISNSTNIFELTKNEIIAFSNEK
jgi:hypothetical protein